jgi:hypothetical protein
MKKLTSLAIIFLLFGSVFGISYGQGTGAGSTAPDNSVDEDVDDIKITGAKPWYTYDVGERSEKVDFADVVVLLQLVLRDKDGNLLGYIETTEKMQVRHAFLYWYLMDKPNKHFVTIDNKPYEVIQWPGNEAPNTKEHYSMAMYVLLHNVPDFGRQNLVIMNHEAYQVDPGDKLEVYWTVLMPVL